MSAGGSFDSGALPAPPPELPAAVASEPAPPACAEIARSCQTTARAVRASMRGGGPERALRQIADARRELRATEATCEGGAAACEDELRYLNAEALNQAGRLDDAVAAYRALDRRGAPSAMRQNALYAAAQIERRQGHLAAAAPTSSARWRRRRAARCTRTRWWARWRARGRRATPRAPGRSPPDTSRSFRAGWSRRPRASSPATAALEATRSSPPRCRSRRSPPAAGATSS